MLRYSYILVFLVLVLSNVELITSKRFSSGGRHSYPKSGGLSGGGHGYPSSGGSHGHQSSGGSHGYPSSGGLSGSGGSHGYPSSGGLSGGGHGYPSSGKNPSYPSSNTGSHGYPSGSGMSGNSHSGAGHTTNIHHHYNYNPPQQIRYTSPNGHAANYPVYHGAPPTYVYQYKDSGSKYGTLLAGLALLNLGTLGVSAYALSKSGQNHNNYKPQAGEVCKFGIRKDNGDYEETRIDCNLISSFILQEEAKTNGGSGTNTTVTTTVTNVTVVNTTNGELTPVPVNVTAVNTTNGELTPVPPINATDINVNTTVNNATSDTTMTSSVTVTTTNSTTVTNALEVKGTPIDVTPGMKCYVISHSPSRDMKKSVPCGLLQSYAEQSLKKNSAARNLPVISIFSAVLAILVAY